MLTCYKPKIKSIYAHTYFPLRWCQIFKSLSCIVFTSISLPFFKFCGLNSSNNNNQKKLISTIKWPLLIKKPNLSSSRNQEVFWYVIRSFNRHVFIVDAFGDLLVEFYHRIPIHMHYFEAIKWPTKHTIIAC